MAKDLIRLLGKRGATHSITGPLPTNNRSWDMVVEQWGVPLIDSEANLMQQINRERIEDFITAMALPGWLKSAGYPANTAVDLQYDSALHTITLPEDSWFVSNGRMIHVSNPGDGAGDPGMPNGGVKISVGSPPSSGSRSDFVFIEFWRHEISPLGTETAASTTTPNTLESPTSAKGLTRDQVFSAGGVQNGVLPNDLITDATVGIGGSGPFGETTRRVQLRWRIRVVPNVNFTTYKFGLGDADGTGNTGILAQGGVMNFSAESGEGVTGYSFTEVPPQEGLGDLYTIGGEIYGKGRLWRAGTGTLTSANDLNTVDGYVYAAPMFRLNRTAPSTLDSVVDMRQFSHVFIPNHVLHADQLTTYDDPAQAGVYGAAFESVVDSLLGRTVKSNIRRNSIKGGATGDIALHSITTDNIVDNAIDGTVISNNSISISKLLIDTLGLSTVKIENRSGGSRSNGEVVVLERDSLQTWNGFYLATNSNSGPTSTIGVVANYDAAGAAQPIPNGQDGYIRLLGQVAVLNVDTAVTAGQALRVSATTSGAASPNNGATEVFAFAVTGGSSQVRALIIDRLADSSIRTSKLMDQAVTTAKIANDSITFVKMASGSVGAAQIVDGSVGTSELADSSVTNLKIADGSVDGNKIAPTSVNTGHLVNGSVTEPKLGTGSVSTRALGDLQVTVAKIADRNVTSSKIGIGAVTSTELADGAVITSKIVDGAVTTPKIANAAVTNAKLDTNSVTSANIVDGTIVGTDLANLAVGTAQIDNLAVTTAKIADLSIATGKIANGSVTNAKLANDSVSSANIIDGTIIGSDIANGSISTPHIVNLAITRAKIANAAVGTAQVEDGSITTAKLDTYAVYPSNITPQGVGNPQLGTWSVDSRVLVPGSVDDTKLADGAVTTNKIEDGAVTNSKVLPSAFTGDRLAIHSLPGDRLMDYTIPTNKYGIESVSEGAQGKRLYTTVYWSTNVEGTITPILYLPSTWAQLAAFASDVAVVDTSSFFGLPGAWDSTNKRLYARKSGLYIFNFDVGIPAQTNEHVTVAAWKNKTVTGTSDPYGTGWVGNDTYSPHSADPYHAPHLQVCKPVFLNAGDYITLSIWATTASVNIGLWGMSLLFYSV